MGGGRDGLRVQVRELSWSNVTNVTCPAPPRWSADLATCDLKKEYYTEIWSLMVSRDNRTVYTAR